MEASQNATLLDGMLHQISTRAWMVQILTSNFGDAPKAFKHEDSKLTCHSNKTKTTTRNHNTTQPPPPKNHVIDYVPCVFLWCCCVVLFLSALWISMLCCFFLSPALQGTTGLYSSASHGPLTKKVITGQKTLGGDGPLGQAFGTAAGRCSEKQS